jgi:hypothetical protein
MDANTLSTLNIVFDFVLVAASIWMIIAVRGVGGLFGRTLNWIVAGAIILGIAHLLATLGTRVLNIEGNLNNLIHRVIVLAGFVVLVVGFRQLSELKK